MPSFLIPVNSIPIDSTEKGFDNMSYFKTTLDNDIAYLLSQIGHNCHVGNIPIKAIVNNLDRVDNYDDKRIITHEPISRGDYIQYADKYFLVVDNVNDKRYNTYYKATMRLCNHDFKIIIGNKLYLFYSAIDGNKFTISEGKLINMSADSITVTIPATSITSQIMPQMAFIKWGSKWEVQGIDYTQAGLITLHCSKQIIDKSNDDVDNEIAGRWDDNNNDLLNGNINPIPPILFEYTLQLNIIDQDDNPVSGASITLLDTDNNTIQAVSYGVYKVVEGLYTYTVSKEGYTTAEGQIMVDGDTIQTIMLEEVLGDNYNIIISGADSIMITDKATYTATVYNNDVVVDEPVTFALSNNLATIASQGNNQCVVKANDNFNTGRVTLRATLINDETVFGEKEIRIVGI